MDVYFYRQAKEHFHKMQKSQLNTHVTASYRITGIISTIWLKSTFIILVYLKSLLKKENYNTGILFRSEEFTKMTF